MTRKYSTTSVATTLSATIDATATTITVSSGTGTALMGGVSLAAGNVDSFAVALDVDTQNEEIVWITQVATDTFTVSRGQAGTGTAGVSGIAHTAGATVKHVFTGDDATFFTAGVATADAAVPESIVTAKGDLLVAATSGTVDNLAVGTNGQVLTADSTQTLGVKWATSAAGYSQPTIGSTAIPSGTTVSTITALTLSGPTLTGTVTAGGGVGTNGQVLSSTGSGVQWANTNLNITFNGPKTTNYSLLASDLNKLVTVSSGSAITVTVPNGIFTQGQQVNIQSLGTGIVTVASDGTTTITATPGLNLRAQYSAATLICTGTNTFTLIGDLSA